jgi:hypothetical protein
MPATPAHLTPILQQIAKKSSNPNTLLYKTQLSYTKRKYLDQQKDIGAIQLAPPNVQVIEGSEVKVPKEESAQPGAGLRAETGGIGGGEVGSRKEGAREGGVPDEKGKA